MTRLHLVDVCGTLVREDTTLGLLRRHFARVPGHRARRYALRVLTARGSPLRLGLAVLERATGRMLLKHLAVALLAGESEAELARSGREYAQELLENGLVPAIWARLDGVAPRDRIVLASASLEPVVKALAEALGARHVASLLEARAGVLTGRYLKDLTGMKEQALLDKFGADVLDRPFAAYSDNLSDRALLARATSACVVLRVPAHRARWGRIEAEFVGRDE